ncbi:MAG: hypothetical protein H0T62_00420 [Parachlamydiaceae bacterium]|nr:hypothetical protein [Parachlamydiaceae bacterium]
MEKSHFICTERLDWTAHFMQQVEETNRSSDSIFESVSTRVAGSVGILFVSLGEAAAHALLTVGKTLTGIVVSPYNCLADTCFPERSAPQDLELSSALIHLISTIECIFTATILPFVCLMNPSRADAWINSRTAHHQVENIEINHVEVNEGVEQLQQEEVDQLQHDVVDQLQQEIELNEKLERSKNKLIGKLKTAMTDIGKLREENLMLAEQLQNAPIVDNTALLTRIADLETRLKESKVFTSQVEEPKINLSNSTVESGPNGEMKRGAGRGKQTPEQLKKAEELRRNRELKEAQKSQTQTKNNESPVKKMNFSSSGPVSLDQLQNFQFKKTASQLSQSQQSLTNSSQLNSSTSLALFQSGFENWDKFNLSNSQLDPELQDDYKNECKDIYNEIIKLEKGTFRKKEQDYLDKISKSTNMNQIVKSLKENLERIERWIDRLENKNIWPEEPFDGTLSMNLNGLDNKQMNKLSPSQLDEIIDYYKAFKSELQKLQKGQNSEEQIQAIQQQKTESEEANRKAELEKLNEYKNISLQLLEFNFDMESNKDHFICKTCFFEKKSFSNIQHFLDNRDKVITAIDALNPGQKIDDEAFNQVKDIVSYLNEAFEKVGKK